MLIVAVIAFVFSDLITGIIFGAGFEPSSNLLKLFALLVLIVIVSMLLGYPFLAALGHARYANYSVVTGSICHLLMLILTIPILSIYSVVVITIVTESIVLAIRIHGVRRHHLWSTA